MKFLSDTEEVTAGVRVGDKIVIAGKNNKPLQPPIAIKMVKGRRVAVRPKKEPVKKDQPKLLRSIIIIDIKEFQ